MLLRDFEDVAALARNFFTNILKQGQKQNVLAEQTVLAEQNALSSPQMASSLLDYGHRAQP